MISINNELYLVCEASWYRSRKIIKDDVEYIPQFLDADCRYVSSSFDGAFHFLKTNQQYKNNLYDLCIVKISLNEKAIYSAISRSFFSGSLKEGEYVNEIPLTKIVKVYNAKDLLAIS